MPHNLTILHNPGKEVSAQSLFKGELGTCTSIQIQSGGILKEHITKTQALLLCVTGEVTFENEKREVTVLRPSDYLLIEPYVKHWVTASSRSQLLLFK